MKMDLNLVGMIKYPINDTGVGLEPTHIDVGVGLDPTDGYLCGLDLYYPIAMCSIFFIKIHPNTLDKPKLFHFVVTYYFSLPTSCIYFHK